MIKACTRTLVLLVLLLGAGGCRTVPPMPPVNLQQPGWTVREGQAIWRMKRGGRDVAGEFLLATRSDGHSFLQFSKNPFTLMTAQTTPNSWEVEVPTKNKRYSGHGRPPKRLLWAYVPEMLAGQVPPKGCSWQTLPNHGWKLENRVSGESIEIYFTR